MGAYFLKRGARRGAWLVGALGLAFVLAEGAARWTHFTATSDASTALGALLERAAAGPDTDPASDAELRRRAFDAGFRERGRKVPPVGPRQGYDGERLPDLRRPCGLLEACERSQRIPFLWSLDDAGRQRVGPHEADRRLRIVGDGAALAPYASTRDTTYFEVLHGLMAPDLAAPLDIEVTAWRGATLASMVDALLFQDPVGPSVAVFMADPGGDADVLARGNKDNGNEESVSERRYGVLVRRASRMARLLGAAPVFVVPPYLGAKTPHSTVEKDLWRRFGSSSRASHRQRLLDVGRRIAAEEAALFLDYSELLTGLEGTYFIDVSQTSDLGQARLAEAMARDLSPLLHAPRAFQSSSTVSR